MKKILLVAVSLLAALSWFFIMRDSDPIISPAKKKQVEGKGREEKTGKGSKGVSRVRTDAPQKAPGRVLTSDCLKKEAAAACKKTKGGKKSTSPTPLYKKPGSLEEGSYSRFPE